MKTRQAGGRDSPSLGRERTQVVPGSRLPASWAACRPGSQDHSWRPVELRHQERRLWKAWEGKPDFTSVEHVREGRA